MSIFYRFFTVVIFSSMCFFPTFVTATTVNKAFAQSVLNTHNTLRARHNAPPLQWDETLADFAQQHVNQCRFTHSNGPYGENYSYGYVEPKDAVNGWYAEIKKYDFSNPKFSYDTAHFTQIVWVNTRKIGCAQAQCPDQNGRLTNFMVCEYSPQGNYSGAGYFEKNVLPVKVKISDEQKTEDNKPTPTETSVKLENEIQQSVLSLHNKLRAEHNAPALIWDKSLENFAQQHANKCQFISSGGPYGESWTYGFPSPKEAINSWYAQGKNYDFSNPKYSFDTGRFTQVIWVGTTKIGCAVAKCRDNTNRLTNFFVCEYSPAGNITGPGYFEKNVLPAHTQN